MKRTINNDLIELEFDVEVGSDPYVAKTEIVLSTIGKTLAAAEEEDWSFIEGKVNIEYHDGHAGITNEMKQWLADIKDLLVGLGVEMRGTGISAAPMLGNGVARITFKCARHWAFDYKTMENYW